MNAAELQFLNTAVQFVDENIAIKPACELLGIEYRKQLSFIKNDPIMGQLCIKSYTVGADNKQREMYCVPKRAFLMWVYHINIDRVFGDETREKVIKIKRLIYDYLFQGEQKAINLDNYITEVKSINDRIQNYRTTISECERELKALYKEQKAIFAKDPRQFAIDFTNQQQLNS